MFLIWQGLGFLGALIPILVLLAGQIGLDALLGDGYYTAHTWAASLCLTISAALVWLLGSKLNNKPPRELIDPKTQQVVLLKKTHALFWIPLQYFSIALLIIAILMLFKN